MRLLLVLLTAITVQSFPVVAQGSGSNRSTDRPQQAKSASEAKEAELKANIEFARKRQQAFDAKTTGLWTRWIYAVCIGCSAGEPAKIKIVYTTPGRVLIGIPAAEDDARAQAAFYRNRSGRRVAPV